MGEYYKTCPRCGGHGIIEAYKHIQDGICFECEGWGTVTKEDFERIEKEIKKETEIEIKVYKAHIKLLDSLKKQWFNNNDTIYILNNNNTYNIKDDLKKSGAMFNYTFKVWYYSEPKENTFSITWNEVLNDNNIGYAVNLIELIQQKSNKNLRGF